MAFHVLRSAPIAGRISFLVVRNDEVVLTCGIAIGKFGGDIWMAFAVPAQFKDLVLETATAGTLHEKLIEGWTSPDMEQ